MMPPTPEDRIEKVRTRIRKSLPARANEPLLIAVTKGRTPETILPYYGAGIRDFGENRAQEALVKIQKLPTDIRWHFIGHLQSNKVKDVLGKFFLIHSVDSLALLRKINSQAEELNLTQDVLLEVNVSEEKTKYGFRGEDEVKGVLELSSQLTHVRILGLMTMAPYGADENELRRVFSSLRRMRDRLGLTHLSMGMSDDFGIAVQEGATMLRIGRALFD